MDRGNNKFNKERNKFNPNQLPPQFYAFNKKTRRFSPNMAYDPSQNPNLNQSEDFIPPAPYPFQNIYPNQMPIPQNKENLMKNALKMYNMSMKNSNQYIPYGIPNYMNLPENNMSLEDNALMINKKFINENKRNIKKRKNNIYISNKDLSEFNNYEMNGNINGNENDIINGQHKANSNENYPNPEMYFNNNMNDYYHNNNYFLNKMGKKKQMIYERINNKNRYKKNFKKKEKRKFDENYLNNINNKEIVLNLNSKPYYPKKKFFEQDSISDLDNNNAISSSEIEDERDEEEIENDYEIENKDKINDKEETDDGDIIILDNSSKDVSALKKIKLKEKKTSPEKIMKKDIKIKDKTKIENKNKIIPELDKM